VSGWGAPMGPMVRTLAVEDLEFGFELVGLSWIFLEAVDRPEVHRRIWLMGELFELEGPLETGVLREDDDEGGVEDEGVVMLEEGEWAVWALSWDRDNVWIAGRESLWLRDLGVVEAWWSDFEEWELARSVFCWARSTFLVLLSELSLRLLPRTAWWESMPVRDELTPSMDPGLLLLLSSSGLTAFWPMMVTMVDRL